jgi:hypothetical protein
MALGVIYAPAIIAVPTFAEKSYVAYIFNETVISGRLSVVKMLIMDELGGFLWKP